MTNLTPAQLQITKEIVVNAIEIMTANIRKYNGANNEAWKASGGEIMTKYGMTEKGALMVLRAGMSVVTGEIHPELV